MKETKTIELKHTHPHKIDVNKIKTLDDVIQIFRRMELHVDDKGLKGIEHLIVEDDSK
ncbi:hypothetical protein OWP17_05940 [Bacillus pacificus]|nr:hypothetical protein [Bacillus pacificus]MDK7384694.1 hypothetical protein [Bacillus pacificus]MDK7396364.1 hypothetical protein [Bacillus pacificus]MDK7400817.1 hypothetical protein [Bacillus pacificus]